MSNLTNALSAAMIAGASMLAGATGAAAGPSIKIAVTGVASNEGYILVALYDQAGWRGAALDRTRAVAKSGTTTVSLEAPVPGTYGIKLFHDVNGNGKMDTNLAGFPTEPVGFSNDAPVRFGPPQFADAAFEVGAAGAEQTISLK
jgi:uncharacterized protein (DUF2141 family)